MTTSSIIKKLASAISANKTAGRFYASGTIGTLESPLTIGGIGPVELKAFLIDPATEVAKLGSNDFKRSHLEQQIRAKKLDVNQKLERGPRSYLLKLTKTIASYERANKQYDSDLKLLARLK